MYARDESVCVLIVKVHAVDLLLCTLSVAYPTVSVYSMRMLYIMCVYMRPSLSCVFVVHVNLPRAVP